MITLFREEISGIYRFLKSNASESIIIAAAALFLTLDHYHPVWNEWFSTFFYYGFLPIIVIILLRKNPLDFGLRLGSPRIWGFYVVVTCLVAAAILYAVSFMPSLQKYYLMDQFQFIKYFWTSCISLAASEFMFRGFLLFGLKDKLKEGSILLQMIPFALLHLGKPEIETISTIVTGILFGYIAYRGKSYWPAFIIHLFINIFFVVAVNVF
jgi:membrane protease YdiL (CAAX protease family)